MAPGFRSPLPLDGSRSYCVPGEGGRRICGPRGIVEPEIEQRILSGDDPDEWIHDLDPLERQLVEEVRDDLWHRAIRRNREQARALRDAVVNIAEREYLAWHHPDLTETSPAGAQLVGKYWRIGVNRNVPLALLTSTTWQAANYWSAAFISYVMREAGAGREFRYAWAHAAYIRAAIDNRLNRTNSMFKGYRLAERPVEPGDIVAKSRDNSGATYDNVQRGMFTHGDIVTRVNPGHVRAIGGNVHANVDAKVLSTDPAGHLTAPGYFVVIKIESTRALRL